MLARQKEHNAASTNPESLCSLWCCEFASSKLHRCLAGVTQDGGVMGVGGPGERDSETQSWLKLLLLAVDKRGHPQPSLLGAAAGVPSLALSSSHVSHTLHGGHLEVKQSSCASCFSVNVSDVSVQLR